ncbi:thymidylate synthase [Caudoviricetes sp.]|nr:thymidylate synthase [Caudoviricetes sp.]
MISAKIIKDSIYNGNRLTTLELEYPRYIHSEFMTHRMFSRNAQSSRAIPIETMIRNIETNPVIPIFMKNKKGMFADEYTDGITLPESIDIWIDARNAAILHARKLIELGVHKQIVNRLLEPFSHIKVIVSATDWDNFFNLRISLNAQQEICELATKIKVAMDLSEPTRLYLGEWHIPYLDLTEYELDMPHRKMLGVARCARVSYLNHDRFIDHEKDYELHDRLLEDRHMSPFEHVSTPSVTNVRLSNFKGWTQYRYRIENI